MPNGLLVLCGMRRESWTWNPADGDFVFIGNNSVYRDYGTSFLCPLQNTSSEKGKILLVGGSETTSGFATTSCEILDFNASSTNTPVRRSVSPTVYRRKFFAPVILPDGKLLVLGGSEQGNVTPVYIPEVFDPVSETWQSNLPPASIPRVYHTVALLLPDGRVWNAGGNPNNGVWRPETEIFSPSYLFAGARPTISGEPTVGGYGAHIYIPTPDAATIRSVSLVRLMATTHHYDSNQRLVWLQITSRTSSYITVSSPINANIAPPGYYMIHVLNDSGVPSVARIIKIPDSSTDTTVPTVAFTSPAANATLPAENITVTGTASDSTGGSGIRYVHLRVDSGSYRICTPTGPAGSGDWSTWTIDVTINSVGSHRLGARATDNAGNTKVNSRTINIA
jgi:galactose oxidase-like protein/Big-like domain-containing protein/Kelch motif protein